MKQPDETKKTGAPEADALPEEALDGAAGGKITEVSAPGGPPPSPFENSQYFAQLIKDATSGS
ncbi:MAG: hypothetical protein IK082_06615 [Oscillospiraceae bacterium]|nr:hypothetical protein [Oscillospiraceae bacterium]